MNIKVVVLWLLSSGCCCANATAAPPSATETIAELEGLLERNLEITKGSWEVRENTVTGGTANALTGSVSLTLIISLWLANACRSTPHKPPVGSSGATEKTFSPRSALGMEMT